MPGCACRSSSTTSRPAAANSRATARPITPAPMTTASISAEPRSRNLGAALESMAHHPHLENQQRPDVARWGLASPEALQFVAHDSGIQEVLRRKRVVAEIFLDQRRQRPDEPGAQRHAEPVLGALHQVIRNE